MFTNTLTIIGSPHQNTITSAVIRKVLHHLPKSADVRKLAGNDACEIMFSFDTSNIDYNSRLDDLKTKLHEALENVPADLCFLTNDHPRKKILLISDMDSTIIQQECIDEIAKFAGAGDQVSQITERAMKGEIEFETALRERVKALRGLKIDHLQKVFDERITLMPGARELVQTMRANGAYCALISGGFTYFTSRVAKVIGFQSNQANELEISGNSLTGNVREPILGREAKLVALKSLMREQHLDQTATMAVGDGANDLQMIQQAALGVAFHAKPIVSAEAQISITHGDLTALLFLQGYSREEFVK